MTARYVTPPRPASVNYDESQVPPFTLRDPLLASDGRRSISVDAWTRRRSELLELFRDQMYGSAPAFGRVGVREASRNERACGGLATHREHDVSVELDAGRALELRLSTWTPHLPGRRPHFLGLNLAGNQSVHPDPAIRLAAGWVPHLPELGLEGHVASEASRGAHAHRWPIEFVLSRGYGLTTLYAGDIEPDYPEGAESGVLRAASTVEPARVAGSIAAWAFGLARALDALEQIPDLDATRVCLVGHSRLAKAALWAAAQDTRFALVLSSGSGRGGAAPSRRRFGETLRDLNQRFPHWFCRRFAHYEGREDELPFDQHELIALIAPRPVYLATAELDLWCDCRGELVTALAASPVYELFDRRGIAVEEERVPLGKSLGDAIGYHRRPGNHDLKKLDWWHFLAFADRWL